MAGSLWHLLSFRLHLVHELHLYFILMAIDIYNLNALEPIASILEAVMREELKYDR